MAKLTPQQFQEKQARNLKASVEDIKIGVNRVTVAPGESAVAAKPKLVQNWNESINNGKWETNTLSVGLPAWKEKTLNKGIPRIAAGIDGAKDKVTAFASQLLPFQDSLVREVSAMPDLSLEDSIARSAAMIRGMSKFRFQK
jgi:hypothetical protein